MQTAPHQFQQYNTAMTMMDNNNNNNHLHQDEQEPQQVDVFSRKFYDIEIETSFNGNDDIDNDLSDFDLEEVDLETKQPIKSNTTFGVVSSCAATTTTGRGRVVVDNSKSPLFVYLQKQQEQQQRQLQKQQQQQQHPRLCNRIIDQSNHSETTELKIDDLFPKNLNATSTHSSPDFWGEDSLCELNEFGESTTSFANDSVHEEFAYNNNKNNHYQNNRNAEWLETTTTSKTQPTIRNDNVPLAAARHLELNTSQHSHHSYHSNHSNRSIPKVAPQKRRSQLVKHASAGQLYANHNNNTMSRSSSNPKLAGRKSTKSRSSMYSGINLEKTAKKGLVSVDGTQRIGVKKSSFLKLLESGALSDNRRVKLKGRLSATKSSSTSNLRN